MDKYLILLVDDDPMSNTYSSLVVKKQNPEAEILTFNNGIEALSYLEIESNPKPDIIFLDLNMPVMNGWDFMEEYQKMNLGIEIIVITSSNEHLDKEKSMSYKGIADYFIKPITLDNVKKLFSRK